MCPVSTSSLSKVLKSRAEASYQIAPLPPAACDEQGEGLGAVVCSSPSLVPHGFISLPRALVPSAPVVAAAAGREWVVGAETLAGGACSVAL